MSPERLLSLRLLLIPSGRAQLRSALAVATGAGEPPEDSSPPTGWLLQRKDNNSIIGCVSGRGATLVCAIDPAHRHRGYAGEALVRLALEDKHGFPKRLAKPTSRVALGLLEKLGYTGDGAVMVLRGDLPARVRLLSEPWAAAYRDQVQSYHRELGIPGNYASKHRLALVTEAERLAPIGRDPFDRDQYLAPPAAAAWSRMQQAAAAESVTLQPLSAYRGIAYQAALLERKLGRGTPIEDILKVSAAPGFSEHHSGLAVDVGTPGSAPLEEEFEHTAAYRWLCRCAGEFGFRLSYPRDNPHGVAFEPWHWAFQQ